MLDDRIFQRLHRSFPVSRHDADRRRDVRSPSLEEHLLNAVADRPDAWKIPFDLLPFNHSTTTQSYALCNYKQLPPCDQETQNLDERTFLTNVIPRLDELLQFLATQARSITSSTTKRNVQRKVTLVASNSQSQCPLCNGDHTLSRCDTFLKLSVQGRSDFVKTNNVCFNCLTQFHSVKTCKSKFRCKKCKKPHHSLLHIENVSAKGRQGAVNVLNSGEFSVNAPVFSPVPISSTSEPSENSSVLDVTSCISDVNPDVQILHFHSSNSELGWIIGGKANSSGQNSFHVNHIQLVSDQLINKFWELDSVPCAKPLTSLEEACEDHFVKTHSRDENGRYTQ
ncbi:uncharacterized protein TNCV_3038121 [Trichonephila clavipes]|nr:uncharacterized protein TNCV_3038121 [Trichonephila clavipes]